MFKLTKRFQASHTLNAPCRSTISFYYLIKMHFMPLTLNQKVLLGFTF